MQKGVPIKHMEITSAYSVASVQLTINPSPSYMVITRTHSGPSVHLTMVTTYSPSEPRI
jgi:hypothetical protein